MLAEIYLEWLQDNQALTPDVDQAAAPNRDAFGIGLTQIPASFCLIETITVAEPTVPPNGTGQLRVTAGTVFGAEPAAYGDVLEVAFQPDPTSYAGIQQAPTNTAGEAFFPVTADASGQLHYRVCAHYRPPVEAASWVTLLYRLEGVNCRASVTGVVVSPSQTSITSGASRQFTVVVEGTPNQAVTWTVDGGGTLTQTGRFTSNGTEGTFFVRATSVEDANAIGVAQITVGGNPPPPPPPALPCLGESCTYSGTWNVCGVGLYSPWVCTSYPSGPPETNHFIGHPFLTRMQGTAPLRGTLGWDACWGSIDRGVSADLTIQPDGTFTGASRPELPTRCLRITSVRGTFTSNALEFSATTDGGVVFNFTGTRIR